MPFTTLDAFQAILAAAPQADAHSKAGAEARNSTLTKPAGSLGRLEDIAIWYASWRGDARPTIKAPQVIVFAGNHGVTAQGVSAFPAEVTAQMVINFKHGGAAINQLSNNAGAAMSVHAIELDRPTHDFTVQPAMSEADCVAALRVGWDAVSETTDLLVVGEMGIGNTTPGAAICNALFGGESSDWTGRGTGVDDAGLKIKQDVVAKGVAKFGDLDALQVLAALGGRELAAMAGAIARARVLRIPVILDGFICCAAAATLDQAQVGALDHCIAGHTSAEAGHERLLAALGKKALLDFDLRLGEGSGAALALPLVKAAVACHSGMATFAEAGVSEE
ncbi:MULTISPECIES: nicotinate-nucleotide--dimethylbenzimidazole phosphoribosyltransferase [Pacificibacter]|uniref:nicotinate-nucleotide--dimethylbenzimidazole phosphoribosyltransferase n=1 Tax=Pacificibacter TaxID=1042323 RepID=UPI001C090FAE|nr:MULTISPECIES: nicotinate-nucleotide--dimethylbenzimidazole phosphoribosyltransferase [Pacificibacter]MBU2935407.1 nicotinate-nucleotide--dimethylbenzimidazole phosphoribosyltransferase [Pacificibacter marinus]MDO6615561.1 nicotinate-nucleotide--dimethylbenzimidazole phosphoribosyltransferase [Pacificibacter sp. 1_MG-2023]